MLLSDEVVEDCVECGRSDVPVTGVYQCSDAVLRPAQSNLPSPQGKAPLCHCRLLPPGDYCIVSFQLITSFQPWSVSLDWISLQAGAWLLRG